MPPVRSNTNPATPAAASSSDSARLWIRIPLFALLFFLLGNLALRVSILGLAPLGLSPRDIGRVIVVGLSSDLQVASWFFGLGFLYLFLVPRRVLRTRWHGILVRAALLLATALFLLELLSEWFFWEEFQSRFNFVAVDYLIYTTEVLGNMWESYPIVWLFSGIGLVTLAIHFRFRKWLAGASRTAPLRKVVLVALALVAGVEVGSLRFSRSLSTDPSINRFAAELEGNGLCTLLRAFRNPTLDYDTFYLTEPDDEVFARTRALVDDGKGIFVGQGNPRDIARRYAGRPDRTPINVMLIVVESLSGHYLSYFGDTRHRTPNLNALTSRSVFFDRMFATGCRTVRGLEALTLSIPPTPGRSVIKRENNQHLCSVGTAVRRAGYDTKFLYGGYAYFDEMSGFFSGNGFDIVDRAEFTDAEVTFSNAWGVCDQDVFARALCEADRSQAAGRPFFQMVMTTSNHRPYTYPQVIDIPSGSGREGAVRYTDFALGELLEEARGHAWFNNTVFAIVADHCASSAGKLEINLAKHHIPCLLYAPELLEPRHVDGLASQIDVAPTLLALLGIEHVCRGYGRNLLGPGAGPGRALVGNYQVLGLFQDGLLTLLKPKREASAYSVAPDLSLEPIELQEDALEDTIAFYQSASHLLREGLLAEFPQ